MRRCRVVVGLACLVTVTDVDRGLSRTVFSSSGGVYSVGPLTSGGYRLRVESAGFRPLVRDGLRIGTGATVRLDVSLELGNASEALTVTAATPILRTGTASLGTVVSEERIAALPLNGRTFITLATLAPGIALQPEPGQVAFFPVVDAVQEFKVESNSPPAEFGRFNGGVINLTTKSGGNTLSGTAFGFLRHESLNARNFFASTDPVKPEFRRTQSGFTLGGPIERDRTFFFVDYQAERQRVGRTVISTVPTLLQRQGVFTEAVDGKVPTIYDPATLAPNGSGGYTRTPFANNAIPTGQMDPVALALLQRYPLPTSSGTANNYRRTANEGDDQDQVDGKITRRVGSKGELSARISNFFDNFTPVTPLPQGSGTATGTLGPQEARAWSFASKYQHVFSQGWLNELRIGDTRRQVDRSAARLSSPASEALGLPGIPSTAQFPNTLPTASRHRWRLHQRLERRGDYHAAVRNPVRRDRDKSQRVCRVWHRAAELRRRS